MSNVSSASVSVTSSVSALRDVVETCDATDPRLPAIGEAADALRRRLLGQRRTGDQRTPSLPKRYRHALRAHVENHGWGTRAFFGKAMSGFRYNRLAMVPGMLHVLGLLYLRVHDLKSVALASPGIFDAVQARLRTCGLRGNGNVEVDSLYDAFGDVLPAEAAKARDAAILRRTVQRITLTHFLQLLEAGDRHALRLLTMALSGLRDRPPFFPSYYASPPRAWRVLALYAPVYDVRTHQPSASFPLFTSGLWADMMPEDVETVGLSFESW